MQEQQELLIRCQKQGKAVASLTKVISQLASLCSTIQDTLIVKYGGLVEEHNEKENLEIQGKEEELKQELHQEEEVEVIDVKEVDKELRKIDQEVNSIISDFLSTLINPLDDLVEPSSIGLESDVKEGVQPPKHMVNDKELEEVKQAMILLLDDDSPPTHGPLVFEEYSPIEIEIDVEISSTLPPSCDIKNGKELEEVGEEVIECEEPSQEVNMKDVCQEVEVVEEEHKGVDLAYSKCGEVSLPKSPSSFTPFKWVKFLSLSFLIPLEYGLLETDGQLRALCGMERKKGLVSGRHHVSQFIMVGNSKFRSNCWCKTKMDGSRRIV